MEIEFVRSGGFAGIRLAASIDSERLATQQAARLDKLVDEAEFFELPTRLVPDIAVPDAFQYDLEIRAAQRRHAIMVVDGSVPDRLRPLLDYLTTLAFRDKKKSGE